MKITTDRRQFIKNAAGGAAALSSVPYVTALGADSAEKSRRLGIGCIGTGSRWNRVGMNAAEFGNIVTVCDVDQRHRESAIQRVTSKQSTSPDAVADYRRVLDRKDVDVVTIVTPDHWHTKIAIEAMQAGKDVYCEKPLTLTIDEGNQIIRTLEQTGRVFQVGTQQRSEMNLRFLKAVAIAHSGRLGKIQRVQCAIGSAPTSGPIPKADVPTGLDWNAWLGQAPMADYRFKPGGRNGNSRCHYEFRWWYEYSGGKMTDWGAHHVDIAQWAIGQQLTGPTKVTPDMSRVKFPVPFDKQGNPTDDSQYNTATEFHVTCQFPNKVEMVIRHDTDNGILIEGDKGRIFVNRGKLVGKAVEELESNPLPENALVDLYKGMQPGGGNAHMRNFFESIRARTQPISDVYSHHRAMTTCHLANIAIRLGREIEWDPVMQEIKGDEVARAMQSRQQREGFEIGV